METVLTVVSGEWATGVESFNIVCAKKKFGDNNLASYYAINFFFDWK